jgi:hypothetical protein
MPMQSQVIVQSYTRDPKGILKAELAVAAPDPEAGKQFAERLLNKLERVVGVDVVRMEADPDAGEYGEPEYLERLGEVPDLS